MAHICNYKITKIVRAFWLAKYPCFNRHATQATLDGVVDADVDYTSNDAGSSPTTTYSFLPFCFWLMGTLVRAGITEQKRMENGRLPYARPVCAWQWVYSLCHNKWIRVLSSLKNAHRRSLTCEDLFTGDWTTFRSHLENWYAKKPYVLIVL